MGKRAHDPSDATIQQTVEEFIEDTENTSVSCMILDLSCSSGPHIPKNLRYALSKLPEIAISNGNDYLFSVRCQIHTAHSFASNKTRHFLFTRKSAVNVCLQIPGFFFTKLVPIQMPIKM
jgi:hypothetical protein